jgi:hypothetical protein
MLILVCVGVCEVAGSEDAEGFALCLCGVTAWGEDGAAAA